MSNKKIYTKPVVVTEQINVGVFGSYGSGGGGHHASPLKFIRPAWLWGICCRG